MSDTQQTDAGAESTKGTEQQDGEQQEQKEPTFTQADIDKIVKERVARERAKFADYDDLKVKAGEKATVEDRLAEMERRATAAEQARMRSDIATQHGISAEDRDLFLTGGDEETLTAQAKALAARDAERKKNGNVVPREGNNPNPGASPAEFAKSLFGGGS